jgi:thioredoxin-related protein
MYSTSLLSALFLGIFGMNFQGTAQVKFQDFSVEKALEKGKQENKMVLVYFSSNQCPGCKIMESQVFTSPVLADLLSTNFVTIRSSASSNEGRMEQYLYQVRVYPSLIYFDPSKGEVMRLEGKKSLNFVLQASNDALTGIFEMGDKIDPVKESDTTLIISKGELIKKED